MKDMETWKQINRKLTSYFEICRCQRKLKSIVDSLLLIREKCNNQEFEFTGSEWLLLALLEKHSLITHGVNCEYPIIEEDQDFWKWLLILKNNPNLIDN